MSGLIGSIGGKNHRLVGVFGDKNFGRDDLVDALKKLQPRPIEDNYCLQCLLRQCVCEPSQEGKPSKDEDE